MKKTKNEGKRFALVLSIISVVLVVAFVLGIVFVKDTKINDTDVIATVNGYDITAVELQNQMMAQKGYVIEEYGDDFETIDEKFWTADVGGTTPIEILRERALDFLTRYKVEQQIAVENGILKKENTTYEFFLEAMRRENQDRSQKIASGQVVYGVKEYTESSYFTYVYSNLQIENKEKLGKKGNALYADDKELSAWYESVKEERYPKFDTIDMKFYQVASSGYDSNDTELIKTQVNNARTDKENGKSDEEIKKNYKNIKIVEVNVDDSSASNIQKSFPSFFESLSSLKAGENSDVFSENGLVFFAKIISRKDGGYKELETYKSSIYTEYISEKYENYVLESVKKAKVGKNENFQKVNLPE